jgi:hypothetical protein
MPNPYFTKFPTILYDILGNKNENVIINILHRAKLRKVVTNNSLVFYEYTVGDGETPEDIAYKYYGDTKYSWVIFLANDIINPYYDWPMSYEDFQATMIKLYGDLPTSQRTLYAYYDQYGNIVDQTTFQNGPAENFTTISAYDYYFNLNESKRSIKLLANTFIAQVDEELTNLLAQTDNTVIDS